MSKSNINTNWFKKTPVFCDAKPICFVSSTKRQLNADVWLAKHPFYTNSQTIIDTEGRVERFMKKYGLKEL
jgi:large subunit ribosomal protein L31